MKWYSVTEKKSLEDNTSNLLRKNALGYFNLRVTLTQFTSDPNNVVTWMNVPYTHVAHIITDGYEKFHKIEFQPVN